MARTATIKKPVCPVCSVQAKTEKERIYKHHGQSQKVYVSPLEDEERHCCACETVEILELHWSEKTSKVTNMHIDCHDTLHQLMSKKHFKDSSHEILGITG